METSKESLNNVSHQEIGFSDKHVHKSSSGSTLLKFLVGLFLVTTIALAVSLGVFVTKYHDLKDNRSTNEQGSKLQETAGQHESHSTAGRHAKVTESHLGSNTPCPTSSPSTSDVCVTEGCVLAAARVKTALDETANPCDDFFQFACGTWNKEHVIPEDKSSFGSFTKVRDDVTVTVKYLLEADPSNDDLEAVKKAKKYYHSCMNESQIEDAGITTITPFMEYLGGWPVLGQSPGGMWSDSKFDLLDLLVKARRYTNSAPVFDMYVSTDDKNPDYHILTVDQSALGMPSRDYFLEKRNDTKLMAYQTYAASIAQAFGADKNTADADMKKMVDLEIDIANITVKKEDRRDAEKLYNKMKVADMHQNFTGFAWPEYVSRIFNLSDVLAEIKDLPSGTEDIIVVAPAYLEKLVNVLNKHDHRTIANYVVWRMVKGKIFYLPQKFRNIANAYNKALTGSGTPPARWKSCTDTIKDTMPSAVGKMFIEEAFSNTARGKVLDLVAKLRTSFSKMLQTSDWMDEQTQTIAQEKLEAIQPRMGYPDRIYNNTWLNGLYEKMDIDPNMAMQNYFNDLKVGVVKNLGKLRKPVDKEKWDMSPATVNAYYDPTTNQITFPAAILQPPFYQEGQPTSMNFGGIGYVIGHEMTHGFDDQGRKYDKTGHLKSWWTKDTGTKFKSRAQCIIDQYGNYTEAGQHLNGISTQGENIADNGGIKESFWAYKKWVEANGEESKLPGLKYTHDQLFFINAAQVWCGSYRPKEVLRRIRTDPHSLKKYRVLGPMQNFDQFAEAFHCWPGSKMNPVKKCAVW